jgi:hypothetical protein
LLASRFSGTIPLGLHFFKRRARVIMDLVALGNQFEGRKFGELVLHHVKNQDPQTVIKALLGTVEKLPNTARLGVESWIDEIAPLGKDAGFWQKDCGEALREICGRARHKLTGCGVAPITDDDVMWMFQIIILNFAYGAHKDAESKAFIQKSIGKNFLRRLFS